MSCDISIIIPIFNEEKNIGILYSKILDTLKVTKKTYEIIFINDCSIDNSKKYLNNIADIDPNVKVIHFRRNYGQTTAMQAGFDTAKGDVIIPMDGDLQNDPKDIVNLLEKLDEGFDVVSGWRKFRKDNTLKRKIPSKIANWIISKLSGLKLHDFGCTLKAYKNIYIKGVRLYGEMHRFIPIYASWQGARVAEIVVEHHPRIYGLSKYGIERTLKVVLDLFVIRFMSKYSQTPMYVFGTFGIISFMLSLLCFLYMVYLKYIEHTSFILTPMPLLVVLFFLMGFLSILMGFIAEILMRTYFESQNKATYLISETKNIEEKE